MKIIDIIKEKYKVAKRFYEANKHTTECSYYMGYMEALGELLGRIEQENEKEIPEKIDYLGLNVREGNLCKKDTIMLCDYIDYQTQIINQLIDYLKNKGE